ncbi:MAG: antitoxin [Lentisphaerae bacterium]|nr:antitoxin [Lentisphaerota bacterium]
MKRTQIQLPDRLFTAAHNLAAAKEISLAELVRRGLEYMLTVTPGQQTEEGEWALPPARDLQSSSPFSAEGWREQIHMEHLKVAEERVGYSGGDGA